MFRSYKPHQMGDILDADLQMRQGAGRDQFIVHIGLKRQLLNINIMAQTDKAFAAFVGFVIGVLHAAQHLEHGAMFLDEQLARQPQLGRIA